jgi:hypothetical protein
MLRQSLMVAFVVGTALCLINQGDALFGPKEVSIWKLVLTYLVPFSVSTYAPWNTSRREVTK